MNNLIIFFNRNKFLFFFLLLQIICFNLIFQNNDFQKRSVFNASNNVVGSIYNGKKAVTDYFMLRKINQDLADENALLRTLLHAENKDRFGSAFEVNDSNYAVNYEFIPTKIIDYTFNEKNNYLTLDVGSNQGVTENMGIIANGVIGKIKEVSPNFSIGYSVLHEDFTVPVKHKKSNQFGLLKNSDKGVNLCAINEFPNHIHLEVGDTIITRGGKGIFPEGIMVGTIQEINEITGSSFYNVIVNLSSDMTNLNVGYVILNYQKEELDSLKAKLENIE